MKIYFAHIDKLVSHNKIPEVTDPVYFDRGGYPRSGGLFSYELFGTKLEHRKKIFGYIDLKGHFFTPELYKALKRMDNRIQKIVMGTKSYSISKKGELIEDEKGGTGLEWLYKNWKKIKFERNESLIRNEKIDLIETHPTDSVFVSKWLVIPPFTRDVNSSQEGQLEIHEINRLYSKLIRQASILASESELGITIQSARVNIQNTLVEIYDHFKDRLSGKYGLIKKNLMAKSVCNANISVITNPRLSVVKKIDEEYISVRRVGIPLPQILSGFTPFIIYNIRKYITNELELNQHKMPMGTNNDGKQLFGTLIDPLSYFNEEFLIKRMNLYINTPSSRFDPIMLPIEFEGKKVMGGLALKGKYIFDGKEESTIFNRPLTWTDLFYIVGEESVEDKYVNIVRHPVLDSFAGFNAKPRILTTMKTIKCIINEKVYEYYPDVRLDIKDEGEYDTLFQDTVQFSNVYAPAMVADYDGDTIINKSIWSQEANKKAEILMKSKSTYIGIDGINRRYISNESVQVLYNLTRDASV